MEKQIIIQKLVKLRESSLTIIMINVFLYSYSTEFNKLTAEYFAARLQANVVIKTDFDDQLKSLNQKINSNKTKNLLKENELKKLKAFDSSYFISKSHFEDDGTQNYLVFQPMYRYIKRVSGVGSW